MNKIKSIQRFTRSSVERGDEVKVKQYLEQIRSQLNDHRALLESEAGLKYLAEIEKYLQDTQQELNRVLLVERGKSVLNTIRSKVRFLKYDKEKNDHQKVKEKEDEIRKIINENRDALETSQEAINFIKELDLGEVSDLKEGKKEEEQVKTLQSERAPVPNSTSNPATSTVKQVSNSSLTRTNTSQPPKIDPELEKLTKDFESKKKWISKLLLSEKKEPHRLEAYKKELLDMQEKNQGSLMKFPEFNENFQIYIQDLEQSIQRITLEVEVENCLLRCRGPMKRAQEFLDDKKPDRCIESWDVVKQNVAEFIAPGSKYQGVKGMEELLKQYNEIEERIQKELGTQLVDSEIDTIAESCKSILRFLKSHIQNENAESAINNYKELKTELLKLQEYENSAYATSKVEEFSQELKTCEMKIEKLVGNGSQDWKTVQQTKKGPAKTCAVNFNLPVETQNTLKNINRCITEFNECIQKSEESFTNDADISGNRQTTPLLWQSIRDQLNRAENLLEEIKKYLKELRNQHQEETVIVDLDIQLPQLEKLVEEKKDYYKEEIEAAWALYEAKNIFKSAQEHYQNSKSGDEEKPIHLKKCYEEIQRCKEYLQASKKKLEKSHYAKELSQQVEIFEREVRSEFLQSVVQVCQKLASERWWDKAKEYQSLLKETYPDAVENTTLESELSKIKSEQEEAERKRREESERMYEEEKKQKEKQRLENKKKWIDSYKGGNIYGSNDWQYTSDGTLKNPANENLNYLWEATSAGLKLKHAKGNGDYGYATFENNIFEIKSSADGVSNWVWCSFQYDESNKIFTPRTGNSSAWNAHNNSLKVMNGAEQKWDFEEGVPPPIAFFVAISGQYLDRIPAWRKQKAEEYKEKKKREAQAAYLGGFCCGKTSIQRGSCVICSFSIISEVPALRCSSCRLGVKEDQCCKCFQPMRGSKYIAYLCNSCANGGGRNNCCICGKSVFN